MKVILLMLLSISLLIGCASPMRKDDYKANELLITFNMHIQSGEYENATSLISDTELGKLQKNGALTEQSIRGMKNLKLSTLRKYEYFIDRQGKLIGLVDVINGTAERTIISQEQRKVKLQKRASTTIENSAEESETTPANNTQSITSYNPYEDSKKESPAIAPVRKNSAEIAGFNAPKKVKVDILKTDIEAAEESEPAQSAPSTELESSAMIEENSSTQSALE